MNSANPADLHDLERSSGVRVRASILEQPDGQIWSAVTFTRPATSTRDAVLVLIYDLSDSSSVTQRLVRRMPDLLRGWKREMSVWIYALSSRHPLSDVTVTNVGHILDDPNILLSPFANAHLITNHRLRGSFLSAPLEAMALRAATEGFATMRAILIGDGKLTDIETVAIPANVELIGFVEDRRTAELLTADWRRILCGGNTRVMGFDDSRLKDWFEAGRTSRESTVVRFASGAHLRCFTIDAQGAPHPLRGEQLEWSASDGDLRILVPTNTLESLTVESRGTDGSTVVAGGNLASAPAMERAEEAVFKSAISNARNPSIELLFDSRTDAANNDAWNAIAGAVSGSESQVAELVIQLRGLLKNAGHKATGDALIFVSRHAIGSNSKERRTLVLNLASETGSTSWQSGATLPIGMVNEAWEMDFDALENRWSLLVVDRTGKPVLSRRLLDWRPVQELPPVSTTDEVEWRAFLVQLRT